MAQEALGWLIIVERPNGRPAEVYNVAISSERAAIEAVKKVLDEPEGVVVKVKSELVARTYKALHMKPGDVMLGARRRKAKLAPADV